MGFKKLPNGGFGVVARTPRAVVEHFFWEVFDDSIEDDAVTALTDQGRVGLEFFEDVLVSVVAIEAHEDFRVFFGYFVNLLDDFPCNTGTLDHLDAR